MDIDFNVRPKCYNNEKGELMIRVDAKGTKHKDGITRRYHLTTFCHQNEIYEKMQFLKELIEHE